MIFSGGYPEWFLGYDSLFQLLFILITGVVAWYSFKMYRLSHERRFYWWGVGFLSLTGAYAVSAFSNYYLLSRIGSGGVVPPIPAAIDVNWLHLLGHLAHTGLFLTGFLLIALVSLDFNDRRLISLFSTIVLLLSVAIVISRTPLLLTLSITLLLAHTVFYAWTNEKRRKSRLRRRILLSFFLLFLGQVAYLLLPIVGDAYVVGHLFELAGFTLLAGSIIWILKK